MICLRRIAHRNKFKSCGGINAALWIFVCFSLSEKILWFFSSYLVPRKNRKIFAKKEQSHSVQANRFICLRYSGAHCDACKQYATKKLSIGRLEQSSETLYKFFCQSPGWKYFFIRTRSEKPYFAPKGSEQKFKSTLCFNEQFGW